MQILMNVNEFYPEPYSVINQFTKEVELKKAVRVEYNGVKVPFELFKLYYVNNDYAKKILETHTSLGIVGFDARMIQNPIMNVLSGENDPTLIEKMINKFQSTILALRISGLKEYLKTIISVEKSFYDRQRERRSSGYDTDEYMPDPIVELTNLKKPIEKRIKELEKGEEKLNFDNAAPITTIFTDGFVDYEIPEDNPQEPDVRRIF